MNRALSIIAVCVSLLALALSLIPDDPIVAAAPPAAVDPSSAAALTVLEQRLAALESQNRALWGRVEDLERVSRGGVAPAQTATAPTSSPGPGVAPLDDAHKQAVREVLAEVEKERDDARSERLAEFRATREETLARDWNRFMEQAQLTAEQRTALTGRLAAERVARDAMTSNRDPSRADGRPDRTAVNAYREERRRTDAAMEALLSDSQKAQYRELRNERRSLSR